MDDLTINTLELWPRKSRELIRNKGLSIRKLRKLFNEHIIFPWEDNYDKRRMLFSTQIQERPLFIIRPESEDDIINTLELLKSHNMTLRIIGGRHSTALQNPDIFLDMSFFNKISKKKYLHVGGGATQGQVNAFLFENYKGHYFPGAKPNHPNSLVFPSGSAATVGVSGISSVGGIGSLRRTLGLTIDSIKGIKIVLPPTDKDPPKIIVASKSKHSDIFWALLGGNGANFGVIIEIYYYIIKINEVILYQVDWDASEASKILTLWQETAPNRPDSYNEDLAIFNQVSKSSGKLELGINLIGIYVIPDGQNNHKARKEITSELRYLGGNLTLTDASDYDIIYHKFVDERVYHNFSVGKTFLTKQFVPPEILLDKLEQARHINGFTYIGLQLMGGKISQKKSSDTAFYPRQSKFFVDIFNFWDSPVDQESNMKWNGKTFVELYPIIGPYSYLGFPVPILSNNLKAYYGDNLEKLRKIKKKVDPLGLLKFPGSL